MKSCEGKKQGEKLKLGIYYEYLVGVRKANQGQLDDNERQSEYI